MGAEPEQVRESGRQNSPVTLVPAIGNPAGVNRRLNGAAGLVKVPAVGEPAGPGKGSHLAKTLHELVRGNGAEPKLRHAGAIYKEALRHSVEPRGAE